MRKTVLVLGGLLLVAALGLAVFRPGEVAGEVWRSLHPNSLVGFGALIEKQVDPGLWVDVILPALQWPAWLVPLVPGLALAIAGRPWRRS
ncbi:MAG: hypothetical protein GDA49_12520 [Rhodospirillales bacterium]|nr:hypothetical protein [Rhodospirillales bacterium]